MYRGIQIRGFRGIEKCIINDLGRVNLFTGYNGAGKTTILEAITVHAKPLDPNVLIELDALRTGQRARTSHASSTIKNLPWGQLFGNGSEGAGEFTIDATFDDKVWGIRARSSTMSGIRIEMDEAEDDAGYSSFSAPIGELNLSCYYENTIYERTVVAFSNGTIGYLGSMRLKAPILEFNVLRTSVGNSAPQRIAEQYSAILGTDAESAVLSAAKTIDSRILRLAVSTAGSTSSLRADIGRGHLLDLPLISDGLTRVVSAALGIAQCKDGAFLIDEFENGVYYGALERTWRNLYEIASRLNVQLFVTTHSMECIEAASRAIGNDLSLFRVDRSDGVLDVRRFDNARTMAAIANAIDLR